MSFQERNAPLGQLSSDNSDRNVDGDADLVRQLQQQASILQTHAMYFLGAQSQKPPESLTNLLNEVLASGNLTGTLLTARRRKEILADEDGRKVRHLAPLVLCSVILTFDFSLAFIHAQSRE